MIASWVVPSTLLLLVSTSLVTGLSTRADKAEPLATALANNKNLTTYYGLVKKYPELLLHLPSSDGVTLIAPHNKAFKKAEGNFDSTNETVVNTLLKYHAVKGTFSLSAKALPRGVPALGSSLLSVVKSDAGYGQNMLFNKQHDNVTVITSGLGSRSTVLRADLPFNGGLIHVVDTLLVPPGRLEPTARDHYKDLQSFLGALYAADLVTEFAETPNVTIFAPRGAAFQAVASAVEGMDKETLREVLRYHMVPGRVMSSADFIGINGSTTFTTANKKKKTMGITRWGNNLYLDKAQLLQPDILVRNGIVHVIDNVLNPELADADTVPDPDELKEGGSMPPAFTTKKGGDVVGEKERLPFTTALPCTEEPCPGVTTTATDGGSLQVAEATATRTAGSGDNGDANANSTSRAGAPVVALPRCTGAAVVAAAAAVGVMVVGMPEVVGIV